MATAPDKLLTEQLLPAEGKQALRENGRFRNNTNVGDNHFSSSSACRVLLLRERTRLLGNTKTTSHDYLVTLKQRHTITW